MTIPHHYLLALLLSTACFGCRQPTTPDGAGAYAAVSKTLSWHRRSNTPIGMVTPRSEAPDRGQKIWTNDVWELRSTNLGTLPEDMVMVSYWVGSPFGEQLASYGTILARQEPPAPGRGLALLAVDQAAGHSLDALAAAAHQGHFFGCGNLEVLPSPQRSPALEKGPDAYTLLNAMTAQPPASPVYLEQFALPEVSGLFESVASQRIRDDIARLEAQGTRHHTSASGLDTPEIVKEMFEKAGQGIPGLEVVLFDHNSGSYAGKTAQKSVIARIPATNTATNQPTLIFGSHLDSINRGGSGLAAPGADDNASGVATLTEVLRVIAAKRAAFDRPIEFHAYAAEEAGLIGSKDIAEHYVRNKRQVAAMLQIDMNAWSSDGVSTTIHLVATDTNSLLRRSVKDLLTTYLGGDFTEQDLVGGTSDHKAWHNQGYPVVFPFENPSQYNSAIHSSNDTSTVASNGALSTRFAKLVLAFAAHHGGLLAAKESYEKAIASLNPPSKDLAVAIVRTTEFVEVATPTANGGTYLVGFGAPQTAATVEYCLVNDIATPACTGELFSAESATPSPAAVGAGRAMFLDQAILTGGIELIDGALIKVAAYDQQNLKLAERIVRIKARP